MAIPQQVLRQAERAEELQRQLQNPQPTDQSDPAPADPVVTEQKPQAPEKAPEPQAQEKDRADWKAKYLVLKGKYDAEVPRYAAEVRELKSVIASKDAEIAQLKQAHVTPQPQAAAAPDDDFGDFDPDLIRKIESRVRKSVEAELGPVKTELAKSKEEMEREALSRFVADVEAEVPDFASIDASPEFQSWASEVDPLSGVPKGALLNDAIQKRNAPRVIAAYRQFKSEVKGADSVTPEVVKPAHSLSEREVPRAGVGAAVPEQKPIFTRAEISAFYGEVSRGRYRGREELAKNIEAQISLAYQEGRVR